MKLSTRTENLVTNGKGYRTEEFRGSGERDLQKVLFYEMSELTNADAINFCLNNYKKYLTKKEFKNLKRAAIEIYGFDDISDALPMDWEKICEEAAKSITNVARRLLGLNNDAPVYCIWLTSKEAVKDIYLIDEEMAIDEYSLDGMFIISDVDYDGALFISSTCPNPTTHYNY